MKYLIPATLLLSLFWNYGTNRLLAGDKEEGPFKPTITAIKNGEVEDRLQYRKEFDTREQCEDFVKAGGDESFRKSTVQALAMLSARGDDEAHLTCEPAKSKDSI